MKQLIEEAKRAIRINSVSANGNEELSNYVSSLLQERGLKTSLQQVTHSLENISKRQFNVIGILGDPLVDKKTRRGLLLVSHLDTVSPGLSENWTETAGDPFGVQVRDGKIFGLGAAAGKLDFLCKLHAIEKFREKKLKMPIYLAGTCGGELGMFGAKYLIKSLALNPKYTLVGDASDLKVVHAHKNMSVFRVSIDYQQVERDARGFNRRIDLHSLGRSAHGSSPGLGINAILQLLDFLNQASNSGFELRFTKLDGGDSKNKVPDTARSEFYLTSHQFEDFKRFFREIVRAQGKEKSFRAELGGLGDMGVRFLPDALYPCTMDVIRFFRELGTEFEKTADASFEPPFPTINFAQIKQRPSGMDLHFDLRLLPEQSPADLEKHVLQGVQGIASRYPNLNVSASRERMNPGLAASADSELVQLCRGALEAAQLPVAVAKKSSSTEAAQFAAAGFESVVFGPGPALGVSHGPNEFNWVEHLEKAVGFYRQLIERTCV